MKKTIILEVEFPAGIIEDADIRDYVVEAIENYTAETGYFVRVFDYNAPVVNKVLFRD